MTSVSFSCVSVTQKISKLFIRFTISGYLMRVLSPHSFSIAISDSGYILFVYWDRIWRTGDCQALLGFMLCSMECCYRVWFLLQNLVSSCYALFAWTLLYRFLSHYNLMKLRLTFCWGGSDVSVADFSVSVTESESSYCCLILKGVGVLVGCD
jgi:hypothetical protein